MHVTQISQSSNTAHWYGSWLGIQNKKSQSELSSQELQQGKQQSFDGTENENPSILGNLSASP